MNMVAISMTFENFVDLRVVQLMWCRFEAHVKC